ncbi:hypothetical protein TPA0905_11920 [Streptomyces olivaceus]|nr:hypothetical protein TPA0905_11920 [Streptomyces olivaceus]
MPQVQGLLRRRRPRGDPMTYKGRTCGSCNGSGGSTETTTDEDGVTRGIWRPCTACNGRGTR